MITPREGHQGLADRIPTLVTRRLTLRPFELGDLEPATQMWADPKTTRFIGGTARDRGQVWQQILRSFGTWALLGYGYWAIEERETGRFVGEAGFMEGLRDIAPSLEGYPEAGWVLAGEARGRGIASEALNAMVAWADDVMPTRELRCIIEPDHAASIRVAEKAGFERLSLTVIAGDPVTVFRRPPTRAI